MSLLSAGVALFFLLALIPALIAGVSIYGLLADPAEVQEQVEDLTEGAPAEVQSLLEVQLERITESSTSSIGFGLVFGLVVTLWAASAGVRHLIEAVNAVHRTAPAHVRQSAPAHARVYVGRDRAVRRHGGRDRRAAQHRRRHRGASVITGVLPFVLLAALFVVSLGILYRFTPNRPGIAYRWVSWGSACGAALWIMASVAF